MVEHTLEREQPFRDSLRVIESIDAKDQLVITGVK